MARLILASGSPQRKKLLKDLGVPFTVKASRVQEISTIKTSCAALVQENALLKARDVASFFRKGIVIGADTLVYGGNKKIIGKPRDLKDAQQILRVLCSKPHWVYTGVAVIDSATGKTIVDCERTKVFMVPLSDAEITRYHKKVSPLDKAGGFDIEGGGRAFIHRIEGCYTNVIGLPIAKLAGMLQKVGVTIL
jgi:septum formation protein